MFGKFILVLVLGEIHLYVVLPSKQILRLPQLKKSTENLHMGPIEDTLNRIRIHHRCGILRYHSGSRQLLLAFAERGTSSLTLDSYKMLIN